MIAENIRDEQLKFIKYNHLVANILAFHNLASMTKAIDQLKASGQEISNEVLAALSPYRPDRTIWQKYPAKRSWPSETRWRPAGEVGIVPKPCPLHFNDRYR